MAHSGTCWGPSSGGGHVPPLKSANDAQLRYATSANASTSGSGSRSSQMVDFSTAEEAASFALRVDHRYRRLDQSASGLFMSTSWRVGQCRIKVGAIDAAALGPFKK